MPNEVLVAYVSKRSFQTAVIVMERLINKIQKRQVDRLMYFQATFQYLYCTVIRNKAYNKIMILLKYLLSDMVPNSMKISVGTDAHCDVIDYL